MIGVPAENIGNHPVDIGLVQFFGMGVMVPSQLVVFQRKNPGGELYNPNFSAQRGPQHVAMFQPSVKPDDQYGFGTRFGLLAMTLLSMKHLNSVGVTFESPFKFWRNGHIGHTYQQGCINDDRSNHYDWGWCSRGCPLSLLNNVTL